MYDCREDPPVLGVCLGMWNFLNILHVRFMFIEPSKWPADQDACFTGLPGNQRVVSDQNLKNHTLVPLSVKYWQVYFPKVWCHEKLHKACILLEKDRNLFSLKRSNRPKVQLWHGTCSKATAFCTHGHYMCAYCGQIQSRGFASLWFISNTWFIDISGASFRHRSKLCSPANRARPAWMKRPSVNIQHRPVRVSCRQKTRKRRLCGG